MKKNTIDVAELSDRLGTPNLIVLDATIPKVAGAAPPKGKRRIPGARFFDIKKAFSDSDSPFPNTFPKVEQFQEACRALGIDNESTVVVYDDLGIYSSPRAWWMLRTMGHKNVLVLDGGLPEWERQGYATEAITERPIAVGNFKASFDADAVKQFEFIQSNSSSSEALVIDARSADRFYARVPEPRADLRGGHIPESMNIPYTEVLENGKFKSPQALKPVFEPLQGETRPLVFSCGSGITACIVLLAGEQLLQNQLAVYDGSWTEYALKTS